MKKLITLLLIVAGTLQLHAQQFSFVELPHQPRMGGFAPVAKVGEYTYYTCQKAMKRLLLKLDKNNKIVKEGQIECDCIGLLEVKEAFLTSKNTICVVIGSNESKVMHLLIYDLSFKLLKEERIVIEEGKKYGYYKAIVNGDYVLGYTSTCYKVYNAADMTEVNSFQFENSSEVDYLLDATVSAKGDIAGVYKIKGKENKCNIFTIRDGDITETTFVSNYQNRIKNHYPEYQFKVQFSEKGDKVGLIYIDGDDNERYKDALKGVAYNKIHIQTYEVGNKTALSKVAYTVDKSILDKLGLEKGLPELGLIEMEVMDDEIIALFHQYEYFSGNQGAPSIFRSYNMFVLSVKGDNVEMTCIQREMESQKGGAVMPAMVKVNNKNYILFFSVEDKEDKINIYSLENGTTVSNDKPMSLVAIHLDRAIIVKDNTMYINSFFLESLLTIKF